MLVKFIDFADQWDYHKRFIIYNLALNHHIFKKILAFKNAIIKDTILKKFNSDVPFYLSPEIVFNEYYDFCYYYKYHSNKKEYDIFLKLIMDTIKNYESNKKCII